MGQKLHPNDVNAVIRLESLGVKWYCSTCRVKIAVSLPKNDTENRTTIIKLNNIEEMMKRFTQTYAEAAKANTERIQHLQASCHTALEETSQNVKKVINIHESAQKMIAKSHAQSEIESRKKVLRKVLSVMLTF